MQVKHLPQTHKDNQNCKQQRSNNKNVRYVLHTNKYNFDRIAFKLTLYPYGQLVPGTEDCC